MKEKIKKWKEMRMNGDEASHVYLLGLIDECKANGTINELEEAINTITTEMESNLAFLKESVRSLSVGEKLSEIRDAVNFSYIAKRYFSKSNTWFYQRMNSNIVNGKPAKFSEEELKTLENALHEIGDKLKSIELR